MSVAETFCSYLTKKKPLDILGFIPRIDSSDTSALVWTEIYFFMKGSYNPFNRPDCEFLPYDRRNHNYFYSNPGDDDSQLGKNISMM